VDQRRLVERARGGDHDAFAELARGAVVRLDQAARLILRDRHTGENCQQLIGCGVGWEAAYVVLSVLYRYASTISFG
jgi:hypothetical protein